MDLDDQTSRGRIEFTVGIEGPYNKDTRWLRETAKELQALLIETWYPADRPEFERIAWLKHPSSRLRVLEILE